MVIKDGKMRKNIVVLVFLGFVVTTIAWADYSIGTFVALKGADGRDGTNGTNGTDCRPTETRTRCYGTGSDKCDDTTRSGVKIVTTQCDGSGSTTSYIYDNNCGITVASTTDVHQDNDSNKPVTHKRVAFKNTCTNETLSTTADVPVGCTPTYTQKYINKETNGSFTYDNASRTEKTIGARVTVSGCGNDNSFDTYDGNDGTSFNYKGSVENCNALYNISNPAQNDAYIVNGDGQGKLCIYNGSSWPTTCPDDCAEFTGPAGDNNCTGYEDSNTAVKHTLRTYSGPSGSTESDGVTVYATRGKMVLTHRMCNTTLNDTVDNENDPCVPIIAPSGVTCNGTYFECKPQGTYDGNTNYAKYNLCEATTGTTFSSALNGKEDTACVGSDSNSALVERKKTVEYTAPSGSGSAQNGTYTWKTTVGKLVNKSVKCSGTASTIGSTPDSCVEIARPNANVCSGTGKVYYECTRQDDNTTYKLCATGSSVLSAAQSAAETAAAAVDPCTGVSAEADKVARTKSTSRTYSAPSGGVSRTEVSYMTVTRNTCSTVTPTQTTYEYDTCKEIPQVSGTCSGNNRVYLECTDQTKATDASGRTYKVCQTVTANTSLANKIDDKIDANYLSQNNYLTSSSSLDATKLTGTIADARLSNKVITTENLSDKLAVNNVITEDNLADKLADNDEAVFNFGASGGSGVGLTLKEVVDLLHAVTGDCTVNNSGMGSTISCGSGTNGALGKNVSITRQLSTSN